MLEAKEGEVPEGLVIGPSLGFNAPPSRPLHGGGFTTGVVGEPPPQTPGPPGALPADGQQGQETARAGGGGRPGTSPEEA